MRRLFLVLGLMGLAACSPSGYFDEKGIWRDGFDQKVDRAVQDSGNVLINGQPSNPFKNHPRYHEFMVEVTGRCSIAYPTNESRYQSCVIREDNALRFENFIRMNQEPFGSR